MAYLGEYIEVGWENEPSQRTPVNAYNLGIMEDGIKRLFAYLIAGGGTGSGTDGREVELRNSGEYIQWRYSGEEDWTNLVSLADLKGEKGDDYVLTDEDIEEIASKVKVATSADKITYDDSKTKLGATNVQDAIGKVSEQKVDKSIINLEKYGIVQADFEYPFTTENYEVAYKNGIGFQNAVNDAKANGIKELIVPEGNYPLCYSTDNYQTVNSIIKVEGVNLIGYGAKLYVIYDELDTGLNPYYTGDATLAHAMCGKVFETDSDIEGFELIGERGYRTTDGAKWREASYGIVFTPFASGNRVKNCKIHRFSGDGIGGGTAMNQLATWLSGESATATAISWNGSEWVESTLSFTTPKHSIGWADISKPMQIRGASYRIWSVEPLKIHCFGGTADAEGDYIGTVFVRQGEPFYFLEGTYYWYLEIKDSAEHTTDATTTIGVAIGHGMHNNVTVDNCEIFANTRGGISNLPSGSVVKNSRIHHNGCAFDGMLAFYDGTQFGIDIEDWYIHEITIDNCLFYGQLHDILYRCDKINILNTVTNTIVKSLTNTIDFYARNSKFYGTVNMNGGISFGKRVAIGCKFRQESIDDLTIVENGSGGVLEETDPTVPDWAKQPTKPTYTAEEVGALPKGTTIPSKTSELTNDSDFQTGEQVRAEIGKMTHYKFEKADSLEDVVEENVIYLIPNKENKEDNIFDEYLLVDGVPELIGSTSIDLSGYALKSEIPTVPETLPNPNTLTFTGAVEGNYDGSQPLNVYIPDGNSPVYTILKDETITSDESGISGIDYSDLDLSNYSSILILLDRTKDTTNAQSNGDLKISGYALGFILFQNLSLANPYDSYRDAFIRITNFGNNNIMVEYSVANTHHNNPTQLIVGQLGNFLNSYNANYDKGLRIFFNYAYFGTFRIRVLAK